MENRLEFLDEVLRFQEFVKISVLKPCKVVMLFWLCFIEITIKKNGKICPCHKSVMTVILCPVPYHDISYLGDTAEKCGHGQGICRKCDLQEE